MTFKYSNVNKPSKDHVLAMNPASLRLSKTAMVPSYRAGSAEHIGNGRELTCGLPSHSGSFAPNNPDLAKAAGIVSALPQQASALPHLRGLPPSITLLSECPSWVLDSV